MPLEWNMIEAGWYEAPEATEIKLQIKRNGSKWCVWHSNPPHSDVISTNYLYARKKTLEQAKRVAEYEWRAYQGKVGTPQQKLLFTLTTYNDDWFAMQHDWQLVRVQRQDFDERPPHRWAWSNQLGVTHMEGYGTLHRDLTFGSIYIKTYRGPDYHREIQTAKFEWSRGRDGSPDTLVVSYSQMGTGFDEDEWPAILRHGQNLTQAVELTKHALRQCSREYKEQNNV